MCSSPLSSVWQLNSSRTGIRIQSDAYAIQVSSVNYCLSTMKQIKITLHEIGHIQRDRLFILVMFLWMEVWDDLYSMLHSHREFFSFLLWKCQIHTKAKCTVNPAYHHPDVFLLHPDFFFTVYFIWDLFLSRKSLELNKSCFHDFLWTLLGQKRERREKKMCLGALTHGGEGERWASLAYQPSLHSASGLRRVLPGSSSQTVIFTLPLGGPGLLGAPQFDKPVALGR